MPREEAWVRERNYQALRSFFRLEGMDERSRGGRLAGAMRAELTPCQRDMARMYYVDQMLMQEIADARGVTASSVSRTLKRARARLRRALRYGGAALLESVEE
jgi:DNA-directed RNA polymerase specialized sigma subunit